jgi:hypothetical protein
MHACRAGWKDDRLPGVWGSLVTRCAPWHIEAMFKEGREELKVEANSAASN